MAKHKLDIEYEYDFYLLGISSHDKDYRFLWALNKGLEMDFGRVEDLVLKEKNETTAKRFMVFKFTEEDGYCDFFVLVNFNGESYLLPEKKKADYLFMAKGDVPEETKERISEKIKKMNSVIMTFEIEPESLKSKQLLIF